MRIPVDESTFVYGYNQAVLSDTMMPESTLKKKTQSITFHHVRDKTAHVKWRMTYINTYENFSDIMNKPLSSGEKRLKFFISFSTTCKRGVIV